MSNRNWNIGIMHDDDREKTREQLLHELNIIREKVAAMEAAEQQDIQQALYKSEERFSTIFDSASVGIVLANFAGYAVHVNPTFVRMLGYSLDELRQMSFKAFTHPEDVADDLALFRQLIQQKITHYHMEERYICKDGEPLWVKINVSLFPGEHKEKLVIAIVEDISQRKRIEAYMLKEKQFTDAVIDSLPGLFYLFDNDGNFLQWNKNVEQITGYSSQELRKINRLAFFSPDDGDFMIQSFQDVLDYGEGKTEAELVTKDGEKIPYLFTGKPILLDDLQCVVGMGINISERKNAEDALRHSEETARQFELRLRALQRVMNQLAGIDTFDDMCRKAVELGRSLLGFDRLSLWFVDPHDPQYKLGSFGTDEIGNTRDERYARFPIDIEASSLEDTTGENSVFVRENVPLMNHKSEVIRTGWNVISLIWNGREGIGWLNADNLIHQAPLTNQDIEILRLFALSLGPLCTRKRAEDALRRSEETARLFQDQLRKLHHVINEMARTETFDDLCRSAIELGHEYLGFERLGLWFIDPDDPDYQVGSFGIDEAGNLRDERHQRIKTSDGGEILDFLHGEPILIREEGPIYDDQSRVISQGQSIISVVWDGSKNIGWVSTDNYLTGQPFLPHQVEIIRLFGLALGPLCKRRQAEDTLRQREESARYFQEMLRKLHYVVNELAKVDTFDELCRHAVELGRSQLGFDRLSLWFVDPENREYQIGSFGTDEQGNIRDERQKRVQIINETGPMLHLSGQNTLFIRANGVHYDDEGHTIGSGWAIAALLWDGDRGIGWLNADNYLHHAPLQEHQKEILQLFGLALGPLCKRRQAEDALRQREESAHHFQEQLRLLHLVINELTKAVTLDELCYQTVLLGRKKLGFDRMSLWFIDPENPSETVGSYGTDETGTIRDERQARRIVQPQWHRDLNEEDFLFVREEEPILNHHSEPVGYGWSMAAVMWDGNKVVGWLNADNFFSHIKLTSHHKEILKLFGLALGPLCTRMRAEEALRRSEEAARLFQEQLRALQIIISELARAKTFDELCYEAVTLGRLHLGFDRMSLWFVAPDNPREMIGSYGTDEKGNIRDERQQRLSVNDDLVAFFEMSPNKDVYVRIQNDLYDEKLAVVGKGWLLSALLLDGSMNIGWISADNYLTKQKLLPHHQEIMRLFGLALGPLCTRKRAEEALQKSEENWRSLVQNAADTIMQIDRQYRIQFVNRLSPGVLPEEVIGKQAVDFALPEYRQTVIDTFEYVFNTGQSSSYEIIAPITSKGNQWHSTRVSPVIHEGEVVALTLISSDITEIKEAERQKVELELEREKMRILSHFISDASHEFRTPLSVINSSLYLLTKTQDASRKVHHQKQIERQVENITFLLEDLIMMTRLDSDVRLNFGQINLNEVARSSPHSLMVSIQEKELQLVFDIAEPPLIFRGSIPEIHQAILNLIDNAIRNTPKGGTITVRTLAVGGYVAIEIEDTGIGIPETELSSIFERFYRIDKSHSTRGFGLGLSITRRIVDLHQGRIEAESHLNQGSTFRILFPAAVVSKEIAR